GHLPATGVRIGGGADGREQHLLASHAELQAERAVAVIEVEPVVRRPQDKARGRHDRFMPSARDLEKDLVLALELDLLVVEPPRQEHGAVRTDELIAREARGGLALGFAGSGHALKIETDWASGDGLGRWAMGDGRWAIGRAEQPSLHHWHPTCHTNPSDTPEAAMVDKKICTFCNLIQGAAEVSLCHEDSDAIAFMDIQPVNNGHVLVVPREHYESLLEVPEELGIHLFRITMQLAGAVRRVSGSEDLNIVVSSGEAAGQDEPHLPVPILPRRAGAGCA